MSVIHAQSAFHRVFTSWRLCITHLICAALLAACTPAAARHHTLAPRLIALSDDATLTIEMQQGALSLAPSLDGALHLSGWLADAGADGLATTPIEGGLLIRVGPDAGLTILIPQDRRVMVTTTTASVTVDGYRGSLDVRTTSGALRAENLSGKITLISNRGEIQATDSQGEFHIAGNYGLIDLLDVRGEVHAANIMGDIHFEGLVNRGDSIHLETDHSAVQVRLAEGSSTRLEITTTSGLAACLLPGAVQAGRGCGGALGSGEGLLQVRTVSGDIRLGPVP